MQSAAVFSQCGSVVLYKMICSRLPASVARRCISYFSLPPSSPQLPYPAVVTKCRFLFLRLKQYPQKIRGYRKLILFISGETLYGRTSDKLYRCFLFLLQSRYSSTGHQWTSPPLSCDGYLGVRFSFVLTSVSLWSPVTVNGSPLSNDPNICPVPDMAQAHAGLSVSPQKLVPRPDLFHGPERSVSHEQPLRFRMAPWGAQEEFSVCLPHSEKMLSLASSDMP